MSSQSSGIPTMDKSDMHPDALQQSQPIDLAAHRGSSAVVQIRPVRSISSLPHGTLAAKSAGVLGTGASAFNLTRTANSGPNLTILPARGTTQTGNSSPSMPAFITTRGAILGGVRPIGQPASITVTPISSSNYHTAGLRLPASGNNGVWSLPPGNTTQGPIRATTITVNRTVRTSETRMINIGNPPNLALLDTKGSVLKPQMTGTPLMNVRGSGSNASPLTLPIAPFTLKANINLQQRPSSGSGNNTSQPKVITQPAHGPPIQLLSTQKLPIHALSHNIPRLNAVCLTLSTHASTNSNNTAPVVAMASRQGAGSSLVMTSSAVGAQSTSSAVPPITKVYPVNREGGQMVETIIAPQSSISASNVTSYSNPPQGVVIASSSAANSHLVAQSVGSHSHHLVQVHGLGGGTGSSNQSSGNNGSGGANYFHVEHPKNINVNLVQNPLHNRPVTIEKRTVTSGSESTKSLIPGSTVILTPNQPMPVAHSSFPHSITSAHGGVSQHNTIIQTHQVLHPGSANSVTVSQAASSNSAGGHHIIPAHLLSQQSGVSTASISVTPITASTTTPQGGISTSTFQSSNISVSVTSANSIASSGAASTSSSTTTMQTSNPAQSPSQAQAKSTLSPRPSILRKRDAGDHNHHILPSRAQRNLALNFTVTNQNSHVASASAAAAAAAAANKENSNGSTTTINLGSIPSQITVTPSSGSVSLLKKEFQPPNEESSWQSCSSNSSGSTTISTTSETAELQIQQSTASVVPEGLSISSLPLGLSLPGISISSTSFERTQSFTAVHSNPQNGVVKSSTSSTGRGKGGKSGAKDSERLKARQDKEEGVSPRKKPRKQQLTTSVFESASPEISFYQGKKMKKADADVDEKSGDIAKEDQLDSASQKVVYYLKKPHMSLLQTNKFTSKPPHNHFQRYSDVKSKDERRPTVNDLLNQKNVIQKCNGWKLQHLNCQVEEIIGLEGDVVDRFSVLLQKLEARVGPNCGDKDLNRIQELLKGNIQRGKVIRDQMLESKSQVLKILEHKPRVLDVISRYNTKRPIKKRERV